MALLALIEEAGNRMLRLDPETLRRLGELQGKAIRVRLVAASGEPMEFYLLPSEAGLRWRVSHETEPDVTLSGDPPFFLRMLLGEGATRKAGELRISGDIELGQRFKRILDGLDLDWEEPLSRLVGDVAAHELGRAARAFGAWGRQSVGTLGQDLAEYLQHESQLLATRARIETFLSAVDELRADADRMEKRLQRLGGLS